MRFRLLDGEPDEIPCGAVIALEWQVRDSSGGVVFTCRSKRAGEKAWGECSMRGLRVWLFSPAGKATRRPPS